MFITKFLKRTSPTAAIMSVFDLMVQRLIAVADAEDKRAEQAALLAERASIRFNKRQSALAQKAARKQEKLVEWRDGSIKEADDARAAAARIQQHILGA